MTLSEIPLSVLDLAQVKSGGTSSDALADTTAVARVADELGFRRFWVAEHHNMPVVASTSPPVLIAHLAAHTTAIRVGSGGVMLPNHAPLVVAEQFALLEALHPGRIDLGIGRAPGTDPGTARALRRQTDPPGVDTFPGQVVEVMALLGDSRDPEWRSPVKATPAAASYPDVWLLGSSRYSAELAGMLGLRYSYAHHFGMEDPVAVMDLYRRSFRASPVLTEPYAMITTSAIIAATEQEADFLAGPARVMALSLRTGRLGPIVTPEEAASRRFSDVELDMLDRLPAVKFLGTSETVVARLGELVSSTQAQELMIHETVYDVDDKVRTLEALAAAAR